MNNNDVILINEDDQEIGAMEKLEAHRKALLHRAVSVFIFNKEGEWLLQRRALHKYHSGGLWTNSCCTHPYVGENYFQAANRRLREEMGLNCPLTQLFHFRYRSLLDKGLTENELDYVFVGYSEQQPRIDADEVCEWKYITFEDLEKDIQENPGLYTYWFRKVYRNVAGQVKKQ